MIVIDVGTRRPLSATLFLLKLEDLAATLRRVVARSGPPREIWVDASLRPDESKLRVLAQADGITFVYPARPRMKAVTEPIFRELTSFLCDRRFPQLTDLGHEIERWRQSYAATK
ncbi:hypothetical protein [Bradyrhizobium diazoefficiens]|uniref:hypothetical protein n=1 Tax=Bradyrhizobium diazoefficiens TaxID=1355477 RepID=UPI00272B2B33|nr:hypothetical protein [Bradyrhizobium diazoefficiens]WLA63806.1 hypothetical protein QNN01_36435 [Bradyrhizobium diazoefficiens]